MKLEILVSQCQNRYKFIKNKYVPPWRQSAWQEAYKLAHTFVHYEFQDHRKWQMPGKRQTLSLPHKYLHRAQLQLAGASETLDCRPCRFSPNSLKHY